jgi:manganese oxidase
MMGHRFGEDALIFVERSPERIGRIYHKAVFRSYSQNFATLLDGPNEVKDPEGQASKPLRAPGSGTEHLGILGPVMRAEVGDTIAVHFRNQTRFELSLHPHGVFYDKGSEGTHYADGSSGTQKADDVVAPGSLHTYIWKVPERSGPGPADPDSIAWPYHSHVNEIADTNSGLVGALIIHRRGRLDECHGRPKGIDREFVNLFAVSDENESLLLDTNIREFIGSASINRDDEDFRESNLMHGINGFVYSNLPGLSMDQGDRVRWYLIAMGTEVDLHTPHWHGATLLENGRRLDTTEVFPASSKTLDMIPDAPGIWMFHCHVNDHIAAGMQALFTVRPRV